MGKAISNGSIGELFKGRFWQALVKMAALVMIVAVLAVGSAGCELDDLQTPFAGDIPFDQKQTVPPDMGVVDNTPTVPDSDTPLDSIDFIPF